MQLRLRLRLAAAALLVVTLLAAPGLVPGAGWLARAQEQTGDGTVAAPTASGLPSLPAAAAASPPAASSLAPSQAATKAAQRVSPLPHELSPWAMFLAADIVVKAVMVTLGFASLMSWAVWLAKLAEIAFARRRTARAIVALQAQDTLAAAVGAVTRRSGAVGLMVTAAEREIVRSGQLSVAPPGIKERLGSELARIEHAAGRRIATGTGILATVGSTAPFVGLFGTVWGIMNSFIGISKSQTTNLAVVAPGIAEALLATAIGLVAAIPAVIFYNQLARAISSYRALVGDAGALVGRIVSRELDRRGQAPRLRSAAE